MKQTTLLFLLPAAFLGFACERHSAESLPVHGAHASGHEAGAAAHAPAHAEAPKTESKKESPVPAHGEAPKFFEGTPAK